MNVLVVHAHPEPESFNGALARTMSSDLGSVKRDPPHPYHQGC